MEVRRMKKNILALTLVLSLGLTFSAVRAYAWYGGGPGGGYGPGGGNGVNVDDAGYKKFMEETAPLRKSLAVDRAEMHALMAGTNPDQTKVRAIAERMTDNQEKLAGIARAAKIDGPAGFGFGPKGNYQGYGRGFGPNKNYQGYGRGHGRGFGRGYGPGYGSGYGRGLGRCR